MTTRRVAPLSALLAAALLVSGCGSEDDAAPASSTGDFSTTSAARNGSDGDSDEATPSGDDVGGEDLAPDEGGAGDPPFPSDASPDEQAASGDALVTVTDIRTGRHDGFDRVVFEVGGEGLPGWDVRYVDDPVEQGSGDPVEVDGDTVLRVTVTGVGYPFDTGIEGFESDGPVPGSGTQVVTEVVLGPTFEGTTEAFIGTSGQSPFRVYLLSGPARIVVEVADPV